MSPRIPRARRRGALLPAACAGAMLCSPEALAEYKNEFIPFPQVILHSNDRDLPPLAQQGSYSAVDFFYTAEFGKTLVLAEFFVDDEEREMERLAVGWSAANGSRAWLGRYHTALGQWNRKHHHGAYLQTTIFRPGIIEFEDQGGVIPAHATGISLDSARPDADRVMHYTLDVGLGPELAPGRLEALDILKPGDGSHALSVIGAVSHTDAALAFEDSGAFLGYVRIPSSVPGIDEVEQRIVGAYSNYSRDDWHLAATLMWVGTRLNLTEGERGGGFSYGYVQPEYLLGSKWTLYGRVEGTHHGKHNLYLQQIPSFVRQRGLIGARYQLTAAQALKVEFASLEQYGERYAQALLQWSAAFP